MNLLSLYEPLLHELETAQLVTAEEAGVLRTAVVRASLPDCTSVSALREALESHVELRTIVAFMAKRIALFARQAKRQQEELEHKEYNLCKKDPTRLPGGRFSEAAVAALLAEDASYNRVRNWGLTLEYYADQLDVLSGSYYVRGRLLEQLSNNARVDLKLSLEGDQ